MAHSRQISWYMTPFLPVPSWPRCAVAEGKGKPGEEKDVIGDLMKIRRVKMSSTSSLEE